MDNNKIVNRVSVITIISNTVLAVIKFVAGFVANSKAMISDAIHTLSDIITTIIALIGVRLANRDDDDTHRYGHERFECIASILLAMLLFITGFEIGLSGIKTIMDGSYKDLTTPGLLALVAAIISILGKEFMFQYTIRAAKKIKSDALKADAWHHRSDAISSLGALIGIALSMAGFKIFDSIASIIIAILICKVAVDIFFDATDKLVDKSCDEKTVEEIKNVIKKENGVLGIDDIKTRIFGSKIYVDVEISADGNKTLKETHLIAEKVHDKIEMKFPDVKHCMVHVNPYEGDKNEKK